MIVKIVHDDGDIVGVFDETVDLSKFGDYKIEEWPVLNALDEPRWSVVIYKNGWQPRVEPYYGPLRAPNANLIYTEHFVSAKDEWAALKKVLES